MSEPLTVLFVDDEPSILGTVSRVLQGSPMNVLVANDGYEALEILARVSVDVLVSDVDMPGMNGFELVSRARREFPSTLRIMLTASSSEQRVLRALNEGEVARFFVKPFEVHPFRDAMHELASRIDRERRARREGIVRERRDALVAWAEARFPGVTAVPRGRIVAVESRRIRDELLRRGLR